MNSYCKWAQTILGLAILAVTVRPQLVGVRIGFWLIVIASILIVFHPWICKMCCSECCCAEEQMPKKSSKRRK